MTKKSPNPTDVHIGSRVRMRRMMLHISQEKLGDALGLTFQQVQKYEKGTNRIGGSRMRQISQVLQVPIQFFYDGAPGNKDFAPLGKGESPAFVDEFAATSDGISIARSFKKMAPTVRRAFVNLAEQMAKEAA